MYTQVGRVKVWGDPVLEDAVKQMETCLDAGAVYGVLTADHHVGYSAPIGGVLAFRGKVSPSAVGYDIACGNKAVLLDVDRHFVQDNIKTIMDEIYNTLSFGIGRKNGETVEHDLFNDPAWDIPVAAVFKELAQQQLGTIGSGNHFVDVFTSENGQIWVGVHFGSRGLGHKLATHFIKAAGGKDGMFVSPVVLDVNSQLGQEYIACMNLAGRYAYAGRDWVCQKVADIIGANITDEVHNNHNFAWKEQHGFNNEEFWVVRKGATPLFPGQRSFIGGSMGDNSYIVRGVDSVGSVQSMRSTVHGAGRVMSRTQAAGKKKFKGGKTIRVTEGAVSREMMMDWLHKTGVELRGAGTDESPHVYKRIDDVLSYHDDAQEVVEVLRPIGVAMAGEDSYDPYKD